jgi:hypothetical protein
VAKKRLTPLPFEAVQAASEWLLERFEQGLSCVENPTSHIEGYVEGGVAPRLTRPRSARIHPQSFQFAYMNERSWIRSLRDGQLHPTEPVPHHVIHVDPHYQPELNRWLFVAHYEGISFSVSLADEYMDRGGDYQYIVHRRLIEKFKAHDNNV